MLNKYQEKYGLPSDKAMGKVKNRMAGWIQDFIRHSPFLVLSTSNYNGDCDASPKGGLPGFVKVLNDRELIIPDVAGNKLFHGYQNIESNQKAGIIFFIPGCQQTVRVNGQVQVVSSADCGELEVFSPDEKLKILHALRLVVDEAYSHCPRAISFSKLWDVDNIQSNQNLAFLSEWKPGI